MNPADPVACPCCLGQPWCQCEFCIVTRAIAYLDDELELSC
jgi:hypothetical protein